MISIQGRDVMAKSKSKENSNSKLNSFLKRLATSLVLIPVVIACIIFGYPTLFLLALLGAALLSWEWANMVPNSRPLFYAITYFFVAVVAIWMKPVIIPAFVMVVALAVAFCKSKGETNRWMLLLGVPYIAIGIGSIVSIYTSYGPYIVLWFMFLVWGVDIGGYFTKPCKIELYNELSGEITLTEGKYHQIKLMAEAVHNQITYLERVSFGPILLDEGLKRGQWRHLTDEEQAALEERGAQNRR
jgi:hypothetical protein